MATITIKKYNILIWMNMREVCSMYKLLYYPNFEIEDLNFLKFALIYIDEIKPIIPLCAMDSLSEDTRIIMEYTDLLQPIHPEYNDSKLASSAAIEYFNYIATNRNNYTYRNRRTNFLTNGKRDYILYEDKYSYEFRNYCLENNYGKLCTEGMEINREIAYSYMSILADVISKEKEIDMITDCKTYADNYFKEVRKKPIVMEQLKQIENEIQFQIPVDMRNIPLENFIRLRSDERFNDARISFSRELAHVLDMRDRNIMDFDLYDYFSCKREIIGLIKDAFVSCAYATVSACSFRNVITNPEKSLVFWERVGNGVGSLDSLKRTMGEMRGYIEELERKRQARRYLAKINRLGLPTL